MGQMKIRRDDLLDQRLQRLADADRSVVFISNSVRACYVAAQRAGLEQGFVIWDYHVVLLARGETWEIFDPDSLLGMPVSAATYLENSFAGLELRSGLFDPDAYAKREGSPRAGKRAARTSGE